MPDMAKMDIAASIINEAVNNDGLANDFAPKYVLIRDDLQLQDPKVFIDLAEAKKALQAKPPTPPWSIVGPIAALVTGASGWVDDQGNPHEELIELKGTTLVIKLKDGSTQSLDTSKGFVLCHGDLDKI